jgi:hypothetical protein
MLFGQFKSAAAVLVVATMSAHAQATSEVTTEQRPISDFNQLVFRGVGEVIVTQSGKESLVVEAERRLLPMISTEVRGGALYLESDHGIVTTRPIRFLLSVRSLSSVKSQGSGDIVVNGLRTQSLVTAVTASGGVTFRNLSAGSFTVRIGGAARVEAEGKVATQNVTIDGSGDYVAAKLTCDQASVSISGSGSAVIAVKDALAAEISGSGEIRYAGAAKVEAEITGAGTVERFGM